MKSAQLRANEMLISSQCFTNEYHSAICHTPSISYLGNLSTRILVQCHNSYTFILISTCSSSTSNKVRENIPARPISNYINNVQVIQGNLLRMPYDISECQL